MIQKEASVKMNKNRQGKTGKKRKTSEKPGSSCPSWDMLFRNMINGAVHVEVVKNRQGNITDFVVLNINRSGEQIINRTRSRILGERISTVFPDIDKKWLTIAAQALKHRRGKRFEYYSLLPDRWFQVSVYSPRTNECVLIFDDITEIRRNTDRLHYSEEAFSSMINAITESALLLDKNGTVLAANRTAAERLDTTPEKLTGCKIFDRLPPDVVKVRMAKADQVFKTGKPVSFEDSCNGITYHNTFYPVRDSKNRVTRLAICGIDITERTRAEERFSALIEGSSDIIQVISADGIMTYLSPSVERVMGYKPEELIGRTSVSIVHPDDLPAVAEGFKDAFDNPGKPVYTVCRCRHKDGSWRVLAGMGINHLDNPVIQGFVSNTRDITNQIESQKSLLESEQKYRSFIEQCIDGVTLIDEEGTIIEFNPGQERISGIPRSEAVGEKVWDIQYRIIPEDVKKHQSYRHTKAMVKEIINSPDSQWLNRIFESVLQRPDGQRRILQTIVFPIHLGEHTIFGSFNRDVTDLKKAEEELAVQNRLLQDKNTAMREVMFRLEEEKALVGRQIHINVERIILPIVAQVRLRAGDGVRTYLDMLEENLREITSSYGSRVSDLTPRLTPREMELCTMIRKGLTSKEIARLTHISHRTVELHRNRIRKKLGITDPAVNLTSYLVRFL